MSQFDSEHTELKSLVSSLSPILITINDEINKLEEATSSSDIKDHSSIARKSINKAHSIVDNFSTTVKSIEASISDMEDANAQKEEQKQLAELLKSTEGPSNIKLNPVSLEQTVSNLNKKYLRVFETVTTEFNGLSRLSPSVPTSASRSHSPSDSHRNTSQSQLAHHPNLVLPAITLESFDGSDITKWPAYKYQLDSLILNQPQLSEVEKAFYIRSSLKGEALSLVSSIPTIKDFLPKILDRLTKEYGRASITQAVLLHSLLRIRSPSNKLEDQISTVRSMINIVHTVDHESGLNGLLTQQQLADRIHQRFIPIVSRLKSDTLLGALHHIEESLRSELEDITMINAISERCIQSTVAVVNRTGSNKPVIESKHSTKASFTSHSSPPKASKIPTCVYCGKHPYSGDCANIRSPKDRKEILSKKRMCYCCFSVNHSSTECNRKCSFCSGKHHRSICDKAPPFTSHTVSSHTRELQRLFTASVIVDNPNIDTPSSARAFIHLDHGSQATIISRDLVKRLSLVPFDNREMTLTGINGVSIPSHYDVVKVNVVTAKGNVLLEAVVQDRKCINTIYTEPLPAADLQVIQETIGQVPRYISERTPLDIDMLLSIGDTLELLEDAKETRLPCGYRLVQSIIGPIVVGSSKPPPTSSNLVVSALTASVSVEEESLESKVERLFSVDPAARIYETTEKESRKVANELVSQHFHDTVEKQGDDYVVQYSLKPDAMTELPSNYDLAASRLVSTLKTLSKQRPNLEYYDSILIDQLSLGQIEIVDPDDNNGIIHYLAHQPVLRPDKPSTPLRIVYDGSAHLKNKPSLNDVIHPGPSDIERIPALLLRARSRRALIVADVEKAFLQVKLHLSQRNMLRFLWVKDIDKPVSKSNILTYRFCVTPFGINQSPCLLNLVINHHIRNNSSNCDPDLIRQLVSNLYVDNVIINFDDPPHYIFNQSKELFETMGMNLRDFASNNQDFTHSIPESNKSKDEVQKLLGILWNTSSDKLSLKIPITTKRPVESKRSMLSAVSSPYDPLGLLNPLTLPPRLTIQKLWNESLKWDDPVDDATRDTFHDQMKDLENFSLSIDRYSHLSDSNEITLVAFSDASMLAMAACVYSCSPHSRPTLLISKTRLAPIKSKSTIPKMELESLLMAHSLLVFTVDALRKEFPSKLITVYSYSDSAVVLHWCKPDFSKPLGVFVTNRVKKIHEAREDLVAFDPVVYHAPRHVRSEHNPADHATRGLTAKAMNDPNHQWWKGPDWMIDDPSAWPNEDLSLLQCPNIDSFPMIVNAVTVTPPIDTVIDLNQFSSLRKAITVTAMVYRYLSRIASRLNNPIISEKLSHLPDSSSLALTAAEKRFASISLIRLHQAKYIHRYESLIKSKTIAQDKYSLWRKNSRLTNSNLEPETKSPIFIPTLDDSSLAKHLILETHLSSSHSNFDVVLNQLKRSYWIPRCRQIAKTVLKSCIPCRKTNNLPFRYPESNPLPSGRVRQTRPFEHCGLDYAGPFLSSNGEKMYVVVFTCFSSRLSHLEIVTSLLTSSFILAFRRFCSRRGAPTKITSDQATTFKLASTLFTKPDGDPNVNTLLSNMGVEWAFTTAHSPWKGGIYERLVKIIKESLTRTIGRKKLSFEEFSTIICEIEALLNSRPLTYVSSDDGISFTGPSLRPIDLISPHSYLGCSIIVRDIDGDYMPPDEENSTRESAIKQLKKSVDTVDAFWDRWHNEYLITLRDSASKSDPLHSTKSSTITPIRGSIVLVVDESGVTPRSSWKMARILSLTENSAVLRSYAGRVIERPLNLLIPLEIHSHEDSDIIDNPPVIAPENKETLPDYEEVVDKTQKKLKNKQINKRSDAQPDDHKDVIEALKPFIKATIAEAVDTLTQYIDYAVNTRDSNVAELTESHVKLSNLISSSLVTSRSKLSPPSINHNPMSSSVTSTPTSRSHTDHNPSRTFPNRNRARSPNAYTRNRSRSRSPNHQSSSKPVAPNRKPHTIPHCLFCKSNTHFTKNCTHVLSVAVRLSIVDHEGRCRKCFRIPNHNHHGSCEPPFCIRGCTNQFGVLERHCEWLCPQNPSLTP